MKEGLGYYNWSNADYVGHWKQNYKHSFGLFRNEHQIFYGHYRRDVPDGVGICTWLKDGNVYEGEW